MGLQLKCNCSHTGVLCGLGYGDNTKAALITRGLAEMVRYGMKKVAN